MARKLDVYDIAERIAQGEVSARVALRRYNVNKAKLKKVMLSEASSKDCESGELSDEALYLREQAMRL